MLEVWLLGTVRPFNQTTICQVGKKLFEGPGPFCYNYHHFTPKFRLASGGICLAEQLRLGDNNALVALRQAWEKALVLLVPEINRPSFESFFRTAKPISFDGSTATIGATSELAKIFLDKYAELIKAALDSCLGAAVEINVIVAPPQPVKGRPGEKKEPRPTQGVLSPASLPLNDKYTFASFVVGPSNILAHSAAFAVAERPGRAYNPFFIYGGPGLGKTHLLQAIGNYALANHPGIRIAYVSGETFTYHYVTALRERKPEEFRQRYRSIDLLLIDDIQFLAGKEHTKEEFFHTFNTLYQMDKQIVLSCDRAPRDLNPLEARLKSRFESGLVVDIAPPDFDTRLAILRNKASAENAGLSSAIVECVARLIQTNVRILEGALITLLAYSSLMKARLTVPLAEEILARYLIDKKHMELTLEAIQRAVGQAFDLDVEEITGDNRKKELVTARHVAMYLCRELTAYSLQAIGKAFGGRDHTTVVHACARVKSLMDEDPAIRSTVEKLLEDLRAGRY